jgi:two-component system, cell cycle sensor histidine kinase and response regulator CckA
MGSRIERGDRLSRASFITLAATVLALIGGGYAYYRSEEARIGREAYGELHAIATLKVGEIELWREERRFDAGKLQGNPFVADAVAAFLEAPDDGDLAARLRAVLGLEARGRAYEDALLIGTDGRILLAARERPDPVNGELTKAVAAARAKRAPVITDLYRCPRGNVHADVVAPVLGADGRPIAAIVLQADAATLLFPLIRSWPIPSRSAETLLVRREGDEVVFLNELRHRRNAALAMRIPLTRTETPAVRAVLGGRGEFRGMDYRGVEVLADLLPIEGSDWSIVAKIDADEILAEVRYRAGMIAVFVALGILFAAAAAVIAHRRRQAGHFRDLYAAERKLREAEEELRTTFYSIGDAVLSTDAEGRVRQMNPVAAKLTGWIEAEARGRPLAEVFRIVNEETRAAVDDPVARVLREGQIVGLANHTVLVAKDGGERPIADSGAPIRDERGEIVGVVLVFRDQTEERAAQAALRNALERQKAILSAVPDIIMEVDSNKVYTWANGPGLEFFGGDVYGKEAAFYFQGEQDVYEQVAPLFAGDEQIIYIESWQRRRDGEKRLLAWWCRVLKGEDGKVKGALSTARDITEHKLAQDTLRDSEARFRGVFEYSTLGKSLTAPDGTLLRVNRAFAAMLGRTTEELQRANFVDLTHPDDLAESRECVRCLLANERSDCRMEKRYRHRDGRFVWADVSTTLLRDDSNAPLYFVTSIADITERKRADEALRASEEKFSKAFQTSPYAITITRPADGGFLDVNDAFTTITGYPREEALTDSSIGLKLWVDEEDRKSVVSALREGKVVAGREFAFRTRSGDLVTCLFSAQLIRLGEETRILSSINDITDRKRIEEALKKSEEKYRILVENVDAAIFVAQNGKLRFVNANTGRVLGIPTDEALSRPFVELIHPDDRAMVMDRHVRRLRGEEAPDRYTFRIVNRAGDTRWAELNVVLIEWGGAPATLNFLTDITDRKRADARRVELEEQLRAAQKMEAIGSLAGGIAHDFNNLLSVILSYTEFTLDGTPAADPRRGDLIEVKKAAERAASLTRQLLAFGRRQILQPTRLDLNHVVVDLEKLLRRILGEDVDMVYRLAPDIGLVEVDAGQIGQVLMNLAVNAREAMPEGGRLTIETGAVELDEEYAAGHAGVRPGPYVLLAVTDTGCGMDAETRARIFEPFFTTKKGKGTGLGLSTVHGIVKQSGGEIWVYSEPGAGSSFKVYLPRLPASAAAAPSSRTPDGPTAGTGTVLVVEDEEGVRNLAARMLRAVGYTVLTAAGGAEAIAACGTHEGQIHLLLTDVVMPEISGKTLAERLAKQLPGIRVLYMSGYTDNAIVHHGVLDKGTSFISKPFSAAELTRKVREVLDAE